ncbi:MAG: hypothetical protein LBU95_00615, partial [Rikenellaceae bacterium]|nr:hypothetical protein [Rikenellaceae bacterium]
HRDIPRQRHQSGGEIGRAAGARTTAFRQNSPNIEKFIPHHLKVRVFYIHLLLTHLHIKTLRYEKTFPVDGIGRPGGMLR